MHIKASKQLEDQMKESIVKECLMQMNKQMEEIDLQFKAGVYVGDVIRISIDVAVGSDINPSEGKFAN